MSNHDRSVSFTASGSCRAVLRLGILALLLLAALPHPWNGALVAGQASGLPADVLQASVRINTNIKVTPDDDDDEPFLCRLDEETALDAIVGSGTIISPDGYVLTNHHVVDDSQLPDEVLTYCEDQAPRRRGTAEFIRTVWVPDAKGNPAEPYRAELVQDSSLVEDLAVLRITEHEDGSRVNTRRDPFPFVQFGDSDALREPETIITIGYPANAGTSRRVSEGIFSGWGDNGYGVPWIYTDATISGGNSGGTAVNGQGLFVGIPTIATISDCRPGDTNNDGVTDENDQGCIGIGGNYGILIPSNVARVFAEEAIGVELPVVESSAPVDLDEPTPIPDDANGPPIDDIIFTPYDAEHQPLDSFQNVTRLEGCFENLTMVHGQQGTVTWYLDDEEYRTYDFEWDETWNPQGCASLYFENDPANPYLDPGTYHVELTIGDQTVVSEELTVSVSTQVERVGFRGRTSDGETIVAAAAGNVLSGEIATVYADITFREMSEGSIWQAEWYRDGELVFVSDPEVWGDEPSGTETVRLRNPARGPLEAGAYELVMSIDGVESDRATVVVEG